MTRRSVRRALTYCGLGVGAAGILLLLLSFFVEFRRQAPSSLTCIGLIIPWWLMVLVGALSAYVLLPEDVAEGHCPKCRFDLRRTPPLPGAPRLVRCPECGTTSRLAPPTAEGLTPA
jgi:hypothetical protein